MSTDPKIELSYVGFTPDLIRFANIYKPMPSFYRDERSREHFTFVIDYKPGHVSYSDGIDALLPYVYDSPRYGRQLRLRAFARPAVFTPGQPAAGLACMIHILDSQNRKRDDVFKCAETITVAVRPWNTIAHYGPHQGELITGLGIDHVELYGLKPEKLQL